MNQLPTPATFLWLRGLLLRLERLRTDDKREGDRGYEFTGDEKRMYEDAVASTDFTRETARLVIGLWTRFLKREARDASEQFFGNFFWGGVDQPLSSSRPDGHRDGLMSTRNRELMRTVALRWDQSAALKHEVLREVVRAKYDAVPEHVARVREILRAPLPASEFGRSFLRVAEHFEKRVDDDAELLKHIRSGELRTSGYRGSKHYDWTNRCVCCELEFAPSDQSRRVERSLFWEGFVDSGDNFQRLITESLHSLSGAEAVARLRFIPRASLCNYCFTRITVSRDAAEAL